MKNKNLSTRSVFLACAALAHLSTLSAQELEWHELDGRWYASTTHAGTWAECRNEAQLHGGELVSLNDPVEEAFIVSRFGFGAFWIGLSDGDGGDGWSSGETLIYQNWRPPLNPVELPLESGCAVMNLIQFGWVKVLCGEVFPAIIERDSNPFEPDPVEPDPIEPVVVDTDDDGLADDEDACPESNTQPTLIIGTCDTGIENFMFEEGCSLADALQQISDEAKNRGQRIRKVARFTRQLQREGLLSFRERIKILRCVAWGERRPCRMDLRKRIRRSRWGH